MSATAAAAFSNIEIRPAGIRQNKIIENQLSVQPHTHLVIGDDFEIVSVCGRSHDGTLPADRHVV